MDNSKSDAKKLRDIANILKDDLIDKKGCFEPNQKDEAEAYARKVFNKIVPEILLLNRSIVYVISRKAVTALDHLNTFVSDSNDAILDGAFFHLIQHLIGEDSIIIDCYLALEKDIRQWADKVEQEKPDNNTDEKLPLELSSDRLQIRVNDKWYDITEVAKDMLKILIEAKGGWVGGKTIGSRPDKLRKKMPEKVANIIDTNKHDGYRIKPDFFRS